MNIHQIIREKRKALALTQEQVAERLGVSTPAVNKWEKGSTYPDITLLPALARLLETDLNTLLSFQADLTDIEIEHFVNDLDDMVQSQGYEAAFQMGLGKIHEYPNCDALIYSVILYLEGALTLYSVQEPEQYRKTFLSFYQRLADHAAPEIRDTAISMLISYARKQEDFAKAEELIHTLPYSSIDQEEQLALLYQQQKKYAEAEKIWEHRVLKGVTDIQTALINMLEIALFDHCHSDAEYFADLYETLIQQFCFPEWMRYQAHLQLALEKKDPAMGISLLQKMLPAMKQEWHPQDSPLYRKATSAGATFLSSRLVDILCQELSTKEEFAFLQDTAEFQALMAEMQR